MREALFGKVTRGSSVFHNTMRNKKVEFNPYIYTLSELFRFDFEISVLMHNRAIFRTAVSSYVKRKVSSIIAENTGSENESFRKCRVDTVAAVDWNLYFFVFTLFSDFYFLYIPVFIETIAFFQATASPK